MYIIIDGYNVLHAAKLVQNSITDQQLVKKITAYQSIRHHNIILVFDAGSSLFETEQYVSGITILYSGQQKTADMAIERYVKEKLRNKEALLVSSDNMLCAVVHKYGVVSIDSELFYKIMSSRLVGQNNLVKAPKKQQVIKYSREENEFIDALMRESKLQNKDETFEYEAYLLKNRDRTSKIDKKMLTILQKL